MTSYARFLAALTAFAIVAVAPAANAQRPQAYSLKTLEDGTRYVGSDVFARSGRLDLSQHVLDQALEISDAAVRHVPSGLTLPRVAGSCTLEWLAGVTVNTPLGRMDSFERGGRGYYACDGAAPAFVVLSFEVDMPIFASLEPDPARVLLAAGMALGPTARDLDCTEDRLEQIRRVACHAEKRLNGQMVFERGLYFSNDDSFLKLNAACLEAQCEATVAELGRLAETIGGARLPADSLQPSPSSAP